MTEENKSRPATIDDLKKLVTSLNSHKVDYFLIGGYAMFTHGFHRATTDIDILVSGRAESGEKIKQALMVLPDGAAKDIDIEWFSEGENIRVADEITVDVMLNACGQTYETLKQYAEIADLDGIPVQTINLEGLLLTKKTDRWKDTIDRIVIERALNEIHKMLEKKEKPKI